MTTDTDLKIQKLERTIENQIEQLCEDTKASMSALTSEVKEANQGLVALQLEVNGIKTGIGHLATRTYLVQTIGDLKEWSHTQLQTHMAIAHKKSIPPATNGKNGGNKITMVLVGAIIALTGAIIALVQFIN